MSNYIKTTNFTVKDSYVTGNPLKIVKGAELDDEFNAIQSSVATKADLASPAFTGTPTVPTPSSGDNSAKIATTAFVNSALSAAYPVGSIYMNASNSTNPATLFGFGTWTAFGAGRMPVGFSSGDATFGTAEATGGSADAIIPAHTHTATTTASQGSHTHTVTSAGARHGTDGVNVGSTFYASDGDSNSSGGNTQSMTSSSATPAITASTTVASTGVSATNANLPPYIVVYMWKRTA